MKLGKLEVHYVDHMGTDLTPVNAARISFSSRVGSLEEKDVKLINYLADHQHLTPFEHQTLTVIMKCPLYIRSQIHRHRTFAFNEVSRRYTAKALSFYIPDISDIRKQSKSNKQGSDGIMSEETIPCVYQSLHRTTLDSLQTYEALVELGMCREQARGVLPQNLMTEFYMTGNLRNWAHFLKLRLDSHAQKEVRDIAQQVSDIISSLWPESYKALMKEET